VLPPSKNPRRDRLRYGILLGVTALVLVILYLDARESIHRLARPQWSLVGTGVALTALFPLCMALRWAATLWAGGCRVTLLEAFNATMAAWPLGTLTPSKTGDLAKAFAVRHRTPLATGLGSVVAERAIDVVVLFALSLAGALALGRAWIAWFALAGIAASIGGWVAIAREWRLPVGPKWQERFAQFRLVWRALAAHPRYLLLSAAASAVNWLLSIWQAQLFYRAYGVDLPFGTVCAVLPVAIFVGLLPVTIAGMGTRDKALMVLLAPVPEAISLSVGILYSLAGYWLPSLIGLPFLRHLGAAAKLQEPL